MSRDEASRLRDIVDRIDAARRAESALERAEAEGDLDSAEVAMSAILYHLLVIGEAVKHLSRGTRQLHPDVPWRSIAGMRDVLAHSYFDVSSSIVRATVDEPLTILRETCARLCEDEERP